MVDVYVLRLKLLALAGFDVLVDVRESVVVDGVIGPAIKPDGRAGRVAIWIVLLAIVRSGCIVTIVVRHDVGERVMADDYVVRPAADEDASVGAKVVRPVGHILEGVVSKGQVGDCLSQRLSSVSPAP